MTKREAKAIFHIVPTRWSRVHRKEQAKKGHGLNGQQILPENLEHLSDFLHGFDVELGYPCSHRKMRRYSVDFDT